MNFIEALNAILNKKKVVRITQGDIGHRYIHKTCDCVELHVSDEYGNAYSFSHLDYSAGWGIYQEQPKLHTFEEAVAALKAGKKIYRQFLNLTTNYTGKGDFLFAFDKEDIFANDWIII